MYLPRTLLKAWKTLRILKVPGVIGKEHLLKTGYSQAHCLVCNPTVQAGGTVLTLCLK